ncbi:MAG: helix-turn-helix domain-containing protein [Bacteroidetes bacterium]|nr:helix-turn-helix domain-containing protein [Bacteroidota bacterium]
MSSKKSIPTYELYDKLEQSIPFNCIELKEKSAYDTTEHHRHSYYEVFLFSKGSGKHTIDFNEYEIKPYSVHFVSPGQIHLVNRSLNSAGFVFLFSREFYQLEHTNTDSLFELPFFNNTSGVPILQLNAVVFAEFIATLNQIIAENNSTNQDKESIIRAYLNILFIKLKRIYESETIHINTALRHKSELVKKLRILIEKFFITHHKPSQYADLLNISTGYLNELTNEVVGKSSTELINERIVLEAKRILFHSDKTVSEIATELNYEDPAYFTRFFKSNTGLSPLEYREKQKAKQ